MSISFDSIGQQCVTASADTSLVAGAVCKFSSNSAVSACADGNPIHGFVENIHGKNATVTVRGFVTAAYSGCIGRGGDALLTDRFKRDGHIDYLQNQIM